MIIDDTQLKSRFLSDFKVSLHYLTGGVLREWFFFREMLSTAVADV